MAIKSPCVDLCRFNGKSGWCEGGGRIREEAQKWRKLTPCRQKALAGALQGRMRLLRQNRKPNDKS
ncbi:DUF1289 domain-containing protein [Pantoea sp. KPR_PJ]|uniref:DUF1289 domain-containing protein n=1 Tax=Pantoea sp. KPR_PJ TaxID=2738375 RepID=UPI0035273C06